MKAVAAKLVDLSLIPKNSQDRENQVLHCHLHAWRVRARARAHTQYLWKKKADQKSLRYLLSGILLETALFPVIILKKYAPPLCWFNEEGNNSVARSVSLASYYSKHIYPAVLLVPGKAQVFTKALGLLIYTMFIKQVSTTSLSMSLFWDKRDKWQVLMCGPSWSWT